MRAAIAACARHGNDVLGLLDAAGLRVEALYGGFAGEPLEDDSREYVFVAGR